MTHKGFGWTILAAGLLLAAPAPAAEEKEPADDAALADLLPGTWRGYHAAGGGIFHHRIKATRTGKRCTGAGHIWHAMTEAQVEQAIAGKLDRKNLAPSARLYEQKFEITVEKGVATFKGTEGRDLLGKAKYNPDVFKAPIQASGICAGETTTSKGETESFHLWKEGALDEPLPLPADLVPGKTHAIECKENPKYHYSVHIPKGYDPATPAPVLIYCSPNGKGKPQSPELGDELGWLMVGLTESKNGPTQMPSENLAAALFDLRRRFRIDMKKVMFCGYSGGAKMAAGAAGEFPDNCAGVICMAGYEEGAPLSVPIFFIGGTLDDVAGDMRKEEAAQKKKGRVTDIVVHPGAHVRPPPENVDAAVRWMAKRNEKR